LTGKDDFLKRGITWACIKWEGNTPKLSDKFIILVIGTISLWRQDFSRNVGIESSSQDLLGDDKISLETSVSEAGLNTVQGWCTTGKLILQLEAETGKDCMNLGDLILEELQSELVESWADRETEAFQWRVLFIQFQTAYYSMTVNKIPTIFNTAIELTD